MYVNDNDQLICRLCKNVLLTSEVICHQMGYGNDNEWWRWKGHGHGSWSIISYLPIGKWGITWPKYEDVLPEYKQDM